MPGFFFFSIESGASCTLDTHFTAKLYSQLNAHILNHVSMYTGAESVKRTMPLESQCIRSNGY